jgi:hypothetical protein
MVAEKTKIKIEKIDDFKKITNETKSIIFLEPATYEKKYATVSYKISDEDLKFLKNQCDLRKIFYED